MELCNLVHLPIGGGAGFSPVVGLCCWFAGLLNGFKPVNKFTICSKYPGCPCFKPIIRNNSSFRIIINESQIIINQVNFKN